MNYYQLSTKKGPEAPGVSSKLGHHLVHLVDADVRVIPGHTVASLTKHPPDLSLHHAADKLDPRSLIVATVFNASLGSVVKKLIVTNPEGGVPCFVVRPAVVGVNHVSPC